MNSTDPQSDAISAAKPAQRGRDFLLFGVLFALVVVSLAGLAFATGWEETLAHIGKLTLLQIAILLVLSIINYGLRSLRWHLFTRRLGVPTNILQDMRHFLGGFAMSATPGRVGELVRMRWLRRETGWSFERTAPLVLVDRASDLIAMALILAAAIMLSAAGIGGAVPAALIALAVAYLATRPRLLSGLAALGYRVLRLWPRIFGRIRSAARSLERFTAPAVVISSAALGVIGWLAEGYAFHLLLTWIGADLGFWTAVGIFVFATLAGSLTGLPGGVGGAEAAMVGLLLLEHVPLEISLPATLIIRVTTLWFAIGIGLAVFPFAERISMRHRHALENH